MKLNKEWLLAALGNKDKEALMEILNKAVNFMDDNNLYNGFGDFYLKEVVEKMTDVEVLSEIKDFEIRSLQGDFYDDSWEWTSKTFDIVTPITRQWYDEMEFWLDVISQRALQGNHSFCRQCFKILFTLWDKEMDDTIIVSHHDVGADNLFCKYDYRAIYESIKL